MNKDEAKRIKSHINNLYGEIAADQLEQRIADEILRFTQDYPEISHEPIKISSSETILITYGNQFYNGKRKPLEVLADFLNRYLGDAVKTIHILPFFPYSSDDGFSVIDYTQVDPDLGDWQDIQKINSDYSLMFDFVLNHISRESAWFQKYLAGDPDFQDYFIEIAPGTDLSEVVRPRALPLLAEVNTSTGRKHVWTTFSDDQIDLNYSNPDVAFQMIRILLDYVSKGAKYIRMDAIAYLWKEVGTKSIHLPQTHEFVKLIRAILDVTAPNTLIITETNVPHAENISYFGKPIELTINGKKIIRSDEAQLVYQFSLAPLVLHTFLTRDATKLAKWASDLEIPIENAYFFNFIASHDGIGIRPAEGILSRDEIQKLVDQTLARNGKVSFKTNPNGTQSPYELNISLFDFLNDTSLGTTETSLDRFMASQIIMLSLAGIPGIYIHSLFGSSNCLNCVAATGRARSINREKFKWEDLTNRLSDPNSRSAIILNRYKHILNIRKNLAAMAPNIAQKILFLDERVFSLIRMPPHPDNLIICLINISMDYIHLELSLTELGLDKREFTNLINATTIKSQESTLVIDMSPYEYIWLI